MILKRITGRKGIAKSASPLSQAIVAEGKFVFLAGQIGRDPETGELPSDFIAQSRQALENLKSVLAASGAGMQDVVRALVAALSPGIHIEIEAIAALP
jgi:enamine deaminase RidA (YjgF/YER057c/UK114 family)